MGAEALLVGYGETRYARTPPQETTTPLLLAEAARAALTAAGLDPSDVDGLAVSSFSLAPDRAIDLAVRLGVTCSWLMDAGTGGASALDMLQHARRAVEAGDATTIVLVAGDHLDKQAFTALVDDYNVATRDHLASIPTGGPNALFALLTQRHMRRNGLRREDYGGIVVAQRAWAADNEHAAYRDPLTLADYLEAPIVADPLGRYDCPPVVAGAAAVVVSARETSSEAVRIRALLCRHGAARQDGDGLHTGLLDVAPDLWGRAHATPAEIDVCSIYDDYPVMVLVQLADLGFAPDGDIAALAGRIADRSLPVNTGGGQLSAGQAGAGGGMLGLVEVVRRLSTTSDELTGADDARLGLVTGYGMVTYRFGASANAAVLERA
jgi:acetyl-CoA acetyltransferase